MGFRLGTALGRGRPLTAAVARVIGMLVLLCASLGCEAETGPPDDTGASCVADLSLDCQPAYDPTYDLIFEDLLLRTCGSAATGSICHYGPVPGGAQGGLALSDKAAAYDALLGLDGGRTRVLPRDPSCSMLVSRLESSDPAVRMPRGGEPVPEAVRCAVRRWIASGADR